MHTRHSAAAKKLNDAVLTKALSDFLGHSSIAIACDIYGRTSDAAARAAINGLSAALGL